jgi:hypothetical protein
MSKLLGFLHPGLSPIGAKGAPLTGSPGKRGPAGLIDVLASIGG